MFSIPFNEKHKRKRINEIDSSCLTAKKEVTCKQVKEACAEKCKNIFP
jgi:hypothetical protein